MKGESSSVTLSEICEEFFLYLTTFRRRVAEDLGLEPVREGLKATLRRVEKLAQDEGRGEAFARIKYQLIVTADHVIIHSDWRHARSWDRLEIEETNGPAVGGDRFFKLLDEMQSPEEREICYTCLALGFEGKYQNKRNELREKRTALYLSLDDVPHAAGKAQITEDAYKETIEGAAPALPVVAAARFAIALAALVVFSWFAADRLSASHVEGSLAKAKAIARDHMKHVDPERAAALIGDDDEEDDR